MSVTPFSKRLDDLHERAAARARLTDFGAADYRLGMSVLLDALDEGPALSPQADAAAEATILGALAGRLHAQAGWKAHPEFANRAVQGPLIVIGLPRTGTTALHQLLSLDSQFQGLQRWLAPNPMPRPPREAWEGHPLRRAVAEEVRRRRDLAPEIAAAHALTADDTDECLAVMAQRFVCNLFPSVLDIPAYDAWFRAKDETPVFEWHRDVLKLIALGDDRRWLLKNPSHLFGAEALLAVFPDACVVQTHRHPAQALSSLFSLLGGIRELINGGAIDRDRMEAREIDFWAEAAERGMVVQNRRPERFVNIQQDEIRRDPLGVARTIYARFGIPLSADAEARMRGWAEANPPEGKSSHRYALSREAAAIAERFAPYIERYGL
jgi:hypothetical protein